MIGTTPFDYILLLFTAFLGGAYLALPGACNADEKATAGGIFGIVAFSCPICDKLLLILFGATFLLQYSDPLRPIIGIGSVAILLYAINKKIGDKKC